MRLTLLLAIIAGLALTRAVRSQKGDSPAAANPDKAKPKEEKLRQELLRRMQADQEARKPLVALIQKGVDPEEIKKKDDLPEVKRMKEIDCENTARMKEILKQLGWPGKSLVGKDGANAAWMLVQHADHDRAFQKECLEPLKEAQKKGEATGEQLAYLTDRVLVGKKRNRCTAHRSNSWMESSSRTRLRTRRRWTSDVKRSAFRL